MIHIFTHPGGGKFYSETRSQINSLSILRISFCFFSILTVYSLAEGNHKWRLCLFSSILGTTSQLLEQIQQRNSTPE